MRGDIATTSWHLLQHSLNGSIDFVREFDAVFFLVRKIDQRMLGAIGYPHFILRQPQHQVELKFRKGVSQVAVSLADLAPRLEKRVLLKPVK
jgi:hypothetical protein